MKIYPNEGPDERAERKRIGLKLTPYQLPRADEEHQAIAQELLSRYVIQNGPPLSMFGADCIALGIFLGSESKDALVNDFITDAARLDWLEQTASGFEWQFNNTTRITRETIDKAMLDAQQEEAKDIKGEL